MVNLAAAMLVAELHVDSAKVKSDVEKGVDAVDTTKSGEKAGTQYGTGFKAKLLKIAADTVTAMNSALSKVTPATLGANTKPADIAVDALNARIKALTDKAHTTELDADDKDGKATLTAFEARLSALSAKVAKPGIDMQGKTRALADILAVEVALDRLSKKTATPGISASDAASGILGGIGPAIPGVGLKAAGAIGLGAPLIGALPAAIATGAAGGVGALGVGVAALGAKELIGTKNPATGAATQGPLYDTAQQAKAALDTMMMQAASSMMVPLKAAFASIPGMISQITPGVTAMFSGAGTLIQPLLAGLTNMAKTVLPLLGQAFRAAAPLLKPLLDGLTQLLAGLLPGLIALLHAAQPAINVFAQILGTLGRDIGSMFTAFAPVLTQSAALFKTLLDVLSGLFPVIGQLAAIFASALGPVFAAFGAAVQALLPFLVTVGRILADLAKAVLGDLAAAFGALAKLLQAVAPALDAFAKVLGGVFTTLENSGIFAILGTALESLVGPLSTLINALLKGLAPILPVVVGFFSQLAGILVQGIVQAVQALLPVLLRLVNEAFKVLQIILPVVIPLLITLAQIFTGAVVAVLQGVAIALLAIINAIPPPVLNAIVIGVLALVAGFKAFAIIKGIIEGAQLAMVAFGQKSAIVAIETAAKWVAATIPIVASFIAQAAAATAAFIAENLATLGIIAAIMALVAAIVYVATHWKQVWGEISGAALAAWHFITGIFGDVSGFFTRIFSSVAAPVIAVFNTIKTWVTTNFDTWWKSNGDAIKEVWRALWGAMLTVFHSLWDPIVAAVKGAWVILQTAFQVGTAVVKAVWNALWGGLVATFHLFWDPIVVILRAGWVVLQALFTAGMVVLRAAWQAGWLVIQTVVQAAWGVIQVIFHTGIAVVQAAWTLFWSVLGNSIKIVWAAIQAVIKIAWDIIVGIFTVALQLITGHWSAAWTAIQNTATQVWNAIKQFFQTWWTATEAIIDAALTFIKAILSAAWNLISGTAMAIWNALKTFFTTWWNNLKAEWNAAVEWVKTTLANAWNSISNTAKTVWNAIWAFFVGWWNVLKTAWQLDINWAKQLLSDAWNAIKSTAATVWNAIKAFFDTWWAGLKLAFSTATEWVKKTLSDAWDSVKSTASTAWNAIVTAIKNAIRDVGNAVRIPIEWVIEQPINAGIIKGFNWISSKVGGPHIDDVPHIPSVPAFHEGVVGFETGTAGVKKLPGYGGGDKHLALLEAGESVVPKELTPALAGWLKAHGVPGHQFGWVGDIIDTAETVFGKIMDMGKLTAALATGNATALVNAFTDMVGGKGSSGAIAEMGKLLVDVPKTLIKSVVDWIVAHITAGSGTDIVKDAESWIGKVPYVWGGTAVPGGADCSGFVQTIYGRHGITAPRTSEAQGAWVKRGGPVPGGLAFYHSAAGGADPGHVAIVADASNVVSQGGGVGPQMMGLHGMPLLWTGAPPGGFPAAASYGGASGGGGGAGVQQWKNLILQALAMDGLSASLLGKVETQMQTESGGNPNAINLTDSNAQAGHPSQGLMQVIPGTFALYHVAGTSNNILDPLANIAAGLNYAKNVYGPNLSGLGEGHGYFAGGPILEPVTGVGHLTGDVYQFGEKGPETVTPGLHPGDAGGAQLAAKLDRIAALMAQLIDVTGAVPAGVGAHVGGALGDASAAASFRSRYPQGGW